MSIAEFVSHLRDLDIRLSAEGERLRISSPKGVLTADLRDQLAERKAEILQFLRDVNDSVFFLPPPILRYSGNAVAPLSFAQERLWFLEQLEPGSAAYNVCRAIRLSGPLNIAAIEQSLTEILRRHEVLRTAFPPINGRPSQVVAQVLNLTVCRQDLRHLSYRDAEVERALVEEFQRAFDLSRGPLLRAFLLLLKDEENILLLTTHHIVSDAWSLGILFRELVILYDAYCSGQPSPLPELSVQYADYATWQREWLQGEVLNSQLSYWKEQLQEGPLVLDLPTDHPRPRVQSFRGSRVSVSLEESLTQALDELSRREGVTLFITLLAAFKTLLYRYTGQEKILIAAPIANRGRPELEPMIGCFVNTLALRTDFSGEPSFRELLYRVRDICFAAYAHQDLPFEKLVEELAPERDLSRNPLCQVMFILQNTPRALPNLSGISFARVDLDSKTSKFDLTLSLRERDRKLIGFVEYSTDLFEGSTIERIIGHFKTLLEGVIADPDQPISKLPLLTGGERQQNLVEWNDTAANYPRNSCIHELFEAQVKSTPEAIAVQFEGKQLTYRELNSRANQLAHYLQGLGAGAEKLVGICVERSLEMVVGLLGILKAGGAYLPLDPAYPRERLEFMLEDAQVSVLVTQEKLVDDRGWKMEDGGPRQIIEDGRWRIEDRDPQSSILDSRLKVVCIDRDSEKIAQESGENLERRTTAQNLAYVIYTSGSTGKPKGVQIQHGSVVNLLCSTRSLFHFDRSDVWTLFHSYAFDFSVWEIFGCLINGGKLLIVPLELIQSPEGFLDLLLKEKVTVLNQTPSAIEQLIRLSPERSKMAKGSSLRFVIVGGEALPAALASSLIGWDVPVWNFYGPTETTVWATNHQMKSIDLSNRSIPVGRPLANVQIYILDSQLQPVPVGVPGELYIGGDGLARGYLNRPDLTTANFIVHPFSSQAEARLYRTGDWVRYHPDGNIEFLGRADNQVKIRGYRVELGEIEALMKQHSAVRDCVVVAREEVMEEESGVDNPKSDAHTERRRSMGNLKSSPRLLAYVVPTGDQPSVNELRDFLKKKLPEYMVPSAFVMLKALPLTPNGKVDRNRLSPSDGARPQHSQAIVEPRTEIEELVAQIWRDVLKLEKVGVTDNFFELGGHSLLAAQMISRLREAFRRDIPLRTLFEAPNVASLAMRINEHSAENGLEFPAIVVAGRDGEFPLSFAQEQLWSLDQALGGTHFFNVPLIYRLSGSLNVGLLEKSLGKIIKRHEALRTVFVRVEGRPVQVVKKASDYQLPVVDLRSLVPGELEKNAASLILEERTQSFDLVTGPLWRIKLLRLTDGEHFLVMTIHHIVCDQWSIRLLRSELATLYESLFQGQRSVLPDVPIQFVDFAWWERQSLDSEFMKVQLAFWTKELSGPLPGLGLRRKSELKKGISFRISRKPIELNEKLFSGIKFLARKENCTPFMVVTAALSLVLLNLTGQTDIRIGTLIANRRRKVTEFTVGHFVNTVILRVRLSRGMSFNQLLRQVREVTLAAYAHQELPFELVARAFEEGQKVDRGVLAQVIILYQNPTLQNLIMGGLSFAPVYMKQVETDFEPTITAFDLILDLKESTTKLTGSLGCRSEIDDGVVTDIIKAFYDVLQYVLLQPEKTMCC